MSLLNSGKLIPRVQTIAYQQKPSKLRVVSAIGTLLFCLSRVNSFAAESTPDAMKENNPVTCSLNRCSQEVDNWIEKPIVFGRITPSQKTPYRGLAEYGWTFDPTVEWSHGRVSILDRTIYVFLESPIECKFCNITVVFRNDGNNKWRSASFKIEVPLILISPDQPCGSHFVTLLMNGSDKDRNKRSYIGLTDQGFRTEKQMQQGC